jgi:hypothetical protein
MERLLIVDVLREHVVDYFGQYCSIMSIEIGNHFWATRFFLKAHDVLEPYIYKETSKLINRSSFGTSTYQLYWKNKIRFFSSFMIPSSVLSLFYIYLQVVILLFRSFCTTCELLGTWPCCQMLKCTFTDCG